jgi:hypothetical protein
VETETKKGKTDETHYVHLSSMVVDEDNAVQISKHARMRWEIENEGFNTQKNHGYQLEHKFPRTNFTATQNYYPMQANCSYYQSTGGERNVFSKETQSKGFDGYYLVVDLRLFNDRRNGCPFHV